MRYFFIALLVFGAFAIDVAADVVMISPIPQPKMIGWDSTRVMIFVDGINGAMVSIQLKEVPGYTDTAAVVKNVRHVFETDTLIVTWER